MKKRDSFDYIYPFTTEAIGGYFNKLNLGGARVLTVGSSLDQAFNALLFGASSVVVLDLCKDVEEFYNIKRDLILNQPRKRLYEEVFKIESLAICSDCFKKNDVYRMNPYLLNDSNYEILREKLQEDRINIRCGDIFQMEGTLGRRGDITIILLLFIWKRGYYVSEKSIS